MTLPRSEIGEIAVPDMDKRSVFVHRFDMLCPVHRVITAVNHVPLETREFAEEVVDTPLTAREKRQKARREARRKSQE
jgi:hypothetical protein